MPTKRLPASADPDHLKHQAKDLLRDFRAGEMIAYQRIREFHPRFTSLSDAELGQQEISLSDALLSIAREYGYASWPRLKSVIAKGRGEDTDVIHNDRIEDEEFRRALDLLDGGDARGLKEYLAAHPELVHRKVAFEGDNYFTDPSLLEFVAENPVRHDRMPENVVEITRIILEAGARDNPQAVEDALMLVASGRVAREAGAQVPLLGLLCDFGADPVAALLSAVGHGEFAAAEFLVSRGAPLDLATAAALNRVGEVTRLLPAADKAALQLALALAALHGRDEVVGLLLGAGADPNRYNPPGAHSHCTPLHSAAYAGHLKTVEVLVAGGARADIGDIHHRANARDWAAHAGHSEIAEFLARQ